MATLDAVDAAAHRFPDVIDLSVGGTLYTTMLATLTFSPDSDQQSGMLSAMFSGRHGDAPRDAQGRYFIDRDGRHFHFVLNYLRHKRYPRATAAAAVDVFAVHDEASYYQVDGLIKWCESQPLWTARRLRLALLGSLSAEDTSLFGQALVQRAIELTADSAAPSSKATAAVEQWFCERPRLPGDRASAYVRLKVAVLDESVAPCPGDDGSAKKRPAAGYNGVRAKYGVGSASDAHLFQGLHSRDADVDVRVPNRMAPGQRGPRTLDQLLARVNGELGAMGMCVLHDQAGDGRWHEFRCVRCPCKLALHAVKLHVDMSHRS